MATISNSELYLLEVLPKIWWKYNHRSFITYVPTT